MSDEPDPSAPAPRDDAALPATQAELDGNGFDPADYDWVPVTRRPRAGGWTAEKQRAFIGALADTASVTKAAQAVGMSVQSCYDLRRAPGARRFEAAWDSALRRGAMVLADRLLERAVEGVEEYVFDGKGRHIRTRIRYNDRLGMFLLRAHLPERYGPLRENTPAPTAPPSPEVGEALVGLTPVTPPEPHLLMPPEERETAMQVAELMDGKLPGWRTREPELEPSPWVEEELERRQEARIRATESAWQREDRERRESGYYCEDESEE